ncbi:MAG: PLP-dependent aminotransferase family protein [Thermoanaerobaculia bacterium]|nr:PLP-dependent aminotransferase family protein [Thermoanaerobaculia bacterium]
MPRSSPSPASPPILTLPPRSAEGAIGRWLYDALRSAILDGRLRPGSRLPSTRQLAKQYAVARGTVVSAFEELSAEGYLDATIGSGTFVAKALPDQFLDVEEASDNEGVPTLPQRRLSALGHRVRQFENLPPRPAKAFRCNQPALDLFPTTLWAQVAGRRLRGATVQQLASCDPLGYQPLRVAIADYLGSARGVRCDSDQVAIVSGTQEAINLVARLFLDPGDRVAIEEPGYLGASLALAAHGAEVVPIPVDSQGMIVDTDALNNVSLAYVTPAHQYPLGVTMTLPRRLALLDWAHQTGALLVEDDYDSEFRYCGRPVPAMQGLDRQGQVLFVGSFSKVLFPALRLGYLVVPPDLVETLAALLSITARHAPVLDQAILADFINHGHFGRHLRRMRQNYAERLAALLEAGRQHLAGQLEISPIEAGLQTVAWLAPGLDGGAVAAAADRHHVEVSDLGLQPQFPLGDRTELPRRHALHLGFAAVDPFEIQRGARALAAAIDEVKHC